MNPRLIEDATWCWWTKPRAVRVGDRLFVAAIDSRGEVFTAAVDLGSGETERTVVGQIEDDDHNNPAIVVAPGRKALVFYARHSEDPFVRFRVSTQNTEISEWGDEQLIRFPGVTSYAQVHTVGNSVNLFTRSGEVRWAFARSTDWGETWNEPRDFVALDTDQLVYMPTTLLGDGHTVRVAIAGHPKEYDERPSHHVWACLVDLATGVVSRPSTGESVANIFDGSGLPLREHQLDLAFECPPDRTVNVFDVSDGPEFEIGFASKVIGDKATIDAQYHVAVHRDSTWMLDTVAPAGGTFGYIPAGMYVGGLSFPYRTEGGRVFATREDKGVWHFEEWTRAENGTWSGRDLVAPGSVRLARPWAVTDPGDGPEVLALEIEQYGNDYMGVLSHVIAPEHVRRA